ncbi:helix-turn-helix domain-containing protein [Streptomyces sp. NPDC008150]|uniref:PucR family transcriptional regulator n=1 Tax=Streptomyces sp. NPDC008150 TaxID=3364816 RepID=UPI0036E0017D
METEIPTAWPVLRRMPDLAALDGPTRAAVVAAVDRLRESRDVFTDRYLALVRLHVPSYAGLSDGELRSSARRFMDVMLSELSSLRVPDAALREMLREYARERAARGIPLDDLALGYKLGSRAMLSLLDEVAVDVALPSDFLLAVHDSTWEFANEAAAIFAGVQHELALERVHFDAERRSAFAAGVLSGIIPAERINHDAQVFGLTPQSHYVALAARFASADEGDTVRRAVASAVGVPADRLLITRVGAVIGFIVSRVPESVGDHLVAVGPPLPLDQLAHGFEEALLTLETARRFAMSGVVRLVDLGPRPLVLSQTRTAEGLTARHLAALKTAGRSSTEIEGTTRLYLECDQDVGEVARRLAVHPNTVRYRVNRFQQLTALDLRRTEDLVISWWLLNRRRE